MRVFCLGKCGKEEVHTHTHILRCDNQPTTMSTHQTMLASIYLWSSKSNCVSVTLQNQSNNHLKHIENAMYVQQNYPSSSAFNTYISMTKANQLSFVLPIEWFNFFHSHFRWRLSSTLALSLSPPVLGSFLFPCSHNRFLLMTLLHDITHNNQNI